jgi:hypothetical protein
MKPRDLRQYARQTNVRLAAGAVLVLLVVGVGLIYIIYGPRAAVMGLLCMGGALLPVLLIALVLFIMDWIVKRATQE